MVVFCIPEYLFGTPSTSGCMGTAGQFNLLLEKKECVSVVTIDETHKIFDRLPSYRPAFDDLRKLSCPIIAMSATLIGNQVTLLQERYLRNDNIVVLQRSVHRQNLKLKVQRYKRHKQVMHGQADIDDDDDDDDEENSEDLIYMGTTSSMWQSTVNQIRAIVEGQSSVVYLDFVKDVDEVSELLKQCSFKVGKYTGKISVEERTESFELGVDNPNINQVVRIGCPRNLGVLLQEVGRAGRQKDSTANGLLLCNEHIDDKHLGLWLKSALDCRDQPSSDLEETKLEMITNYLKAWRFIYSLYHGKCLVWALSHFYAGADDQDPPTCFVANNPLCTVCEESEAICQESIDIQQYMVVFLETL